jgi:DNA-binding transcriptional LysR family regulator
LSPPHPAVISNSATYLKALLSTGNYLSFLPRLLVGDSTDLLPLEVDMPSFSADVTMSYRERSLLNPACVEVAETFRIVSAERTERLMAASA